MVGRRADRDRPFVLVPAGWGARGVGGCVARPGTSCAAGDMSSRAEAFDAVGDGNPVPVRVGCPRLERTASGRAECPPAVLPVGPVVIICGQFAVCGP